MEEIKTFSIPYTTEDMEYLRNNKGIVDMSNINIPNISPDSQIPISLIYLRNTNFDVELDFTNCCTDIKYKFLLEYLTTKIECKSDILEDTWISILLATLGFECENKGILDRESLKRFIELNKHLIKDTLQFLVSLPIYAMFRFENGFKINLEGITHSNLNCLGINIYRLIKHPGLEKILSMNIDLEPIFYDYYFTVDNDRLMDSIAGLDYMPILIGLSERTNEEWKKALVSE